MVGDAPNSISRYNWVHNTRKYTLRFDGNPGGQNGLNHHNAVWDAATMRFKGDFHQTYNNFGFDPRDSSKGNVNIATDKGGNTNAITINNAAALISPDSGLPGTSSNNWNGAWTGTDIRDQVRDADNLDFRPQADPALVDAGVVIAGITDGYIGAAPDIGAYEYGDSNYWIAGRKLAQTSTPVPPNLSSAVQTDADLMWLEGYEADSNAVYFGTSPSNLVFQGIQTNNIFAPGALSNASNYFWRVDAIGAGGTVIGEVWSFTVASAPVLADLVYAEYTNAPLDNAVTWFLAISNVWTTMTVAQNDGADAERMYGQTFKAAADFNLAAISFHATSVTKTYGTNQVLELALLVDTTSNDVPDTLIGDVLSVAFSSIDGSRPWKRLALQNPVPMQGNKTYGFVYTLIGPISDNQRVANSKTGGYADGKAINTDYPAGSFPGSLPPALSSPRDIAFTIQSASAAEIYATWTAGYSISGNDGYDDNPDGDALENLAEYGLGGSPTNHDAFAILPRFGNKLGGGSASMEYIYRRRTDRVARGLDYYLELCTDLVSNDWNTNGYAEAGFAPLETGFEAVTNQILTTETNQFIRLRISID